MESNSDFVFYGAAIFVVAICAGVLFVIIRAVRAHSNSGGHKPEVASKINEFFGSQDVSR